MSKRQLTLAVTFDSSIPSSDLLEVELDMATNIMIKIKITRTPIDTNIIVFFQKDHPSEGIFFAKEPTSPNL